jgi:hypothetical protein
MATSGITKPGDIVVKSIECYNRLIVDRNCNLNVPKAYIEDELTVGIGGNVNMPATTIDFTNSTMNFTGAAITGLTGNITGNLSFQGNIIADGVIATKFYGGTYCGAVKATTISTETLTVTDTILGDLCGSILTDMISEKTMGGGIMMVGDVNGDFFGTFTGASSGTHTGPVVTTSITGGGDIIVTGTLKGDFMGNLMGTGTGSFFGDFCGNASIATLTPKAPATNIKVNGDLVLTDGNIVQGNLCVDTLFAGNIMNKGMGFINITPGINTPSLVTGNLAIVNLSATNITTGIITATTGCFNVVKTNTILENSPGGIDVNSQTRFNANVCITDLQLGTVSSKIMGEPIEVLSNIQMGPNSLFADQVCANVLLADQLIGKHGLISLGNTISDVVCANVKVLTPLLVEKHPGEGILVQGNVVVEPEYTLTANVLGNVANIDTIYSELLCSNVIRTDILEGKTGNLITITSNIEATNGLSVDGPVVLNGGLNIVGGAIFDELNVTMLSIDFILPAVENSVTLTGNLDVTETVTANKFTGNSLCINDIYPRNGPSVTLQGNLIVTGNIATPKLTGDSICVDLISPITGTSVTLDGNLLVKGNVTTPKLTGNSICVDLISPITGTSVTLDGNLLVNGNVTADKFMGGNICGDAVWINGIQVLYLQQPAVADASTTAVSLTDNTTGTANQSVENVSTSVGTVTAYVATGGGGVTVTSSAATDLDTTQTGLATLTSEVNTLASTVDTRLGTINDNFADLSDEVNKLVTDVETLRDQLNSALDTLRAHGIIAT